jgi:hypothetical protein
VNNRLQDDRRIGGPSCRRWLRSTLLAVALGLLTTGCQSSSAPKSPGSSFNPLHAIPVVGAKAKEDALRQRVEADPFPTAAKAGL